MNLCVGLTELCERQSNGWTIIGGIGDIRRGDHGAVSPTGAL